MILEAVWFKNGKEIDWVDPVENVRYDQYVDDIFNIEVYNGHAWYSAEDCNEVPDDFVISIKRKPLSDYCN
jgi:hypothetical protein